MALKDISELLNSQGALYHGVRGALMVAAFDVYNEAVETTNHANRINWAAAVVLGSLDDMTTKFYRLVLTNATIRAAGNEATDNEIQFTVNGFINIAANRMTAV